MVEGGEGVSVKMGLYVDAVGEMYHNVSKSEPVVPYEGAIV